MRTEDLMLLRASFDRERQANQSRYRNLGKLQKAFVSTFPLSRIRKLSLKDYVEGKGNKDSFCYWVEHKTLALGNIFSRGGASKFVVFFDKKAQRYKFQKKFKTEKDAIIFLREQISRLIEAGRTNNLEVIRQIEISEMFKGKILFLYYPEKYLNIFSEKYVDYFLREIGWPLPNHILEKRKSLCDFKSDGEVMSKWTMYEFTDFLYDKFGSPKNEPRTLTNTQVNSQNSAIDDIPSAPVGSQSPERTSTPGIRYQRDEKVRRFVIGQAKGACEYCGELGFLLPDGSHYIEAHHIIALAAQGPDTVDNVIALCPSDHREVHYGKNAVAMENQMVEIIKARKLRARCKQQITTQEILAATETAH